MYRFFFLRLIAGAAGWFMADRKGRNRLLWLLLCAAFPPLLIVILLLPLKLSGGRTKACAGCGRIIRREEAKCRHCGREQPINLVQCESCGGFVPEREYCAACNRRLKP